MTLEAKIKECGEETQRLAMRAYELAQSTRTPSATFYDWLIGQSRYWHRRTVRRGLNRHEIERYREIEHLKEFMERESLK